MFRPENRKKPTPISKQRVKVAAMQTELRYERPFLPLSVPVGLGPKHSEVRVQAVTLRVKMGWACDAHIPLTSITGAERTNARVFAWGRALLGRTLAGQRLGQGAGGFHD